MPIINNNMWRYGAIATAVSLSLTACFDNDGGTTQEYTVTPPTDFNQPPPPPESRELTTFAPDGVEASIQRTDHGVPYITADSLEGVAFGTAWAFAEDNICILADQVVRFNGERSRYFGPDAEPGSGDNANIINDFTYRALGLREMAEAHMDELSEESQALLQGYAAGYNHYLAETGADQIAPQCASQPWVQPIEAEDMLTYALGVALLPGAANFLEPLFIATPPGQDFTPQPVADGSSDAQATGTFDFNFDASKVTAPDPNPAQLGSNGWALGADMTASGHGALIANPHFPHVGNQRFWEFGIEIPGELKVVGGSLSGMPGVVNIGFNEDVAWTHTFSTAERFVVYQLELDESDSEHMTYLVDGEPHPIERETITVEVAVAPGMTMEMERDFYTSSFGPMLNVPGDFEWGGDFQGTTSAFALHDANLPNFDILDHWLALNMARDIDEVEQSFHDYTGLIFNNAMVADRHGEVFFTDGSAVPDLPPAALQRLRTDPALVAVRNQAPFTLVPGTSEDYRAQGRVPFERAPQLRRSDFVQNSNDSYWLTNPDAPLSSPDYLLYGRFNNQQTLRSRMGQLKLSELSGSATQQDLAETLLSNRALLGEKAVPVLLALCEQAGDTPFDTDYGEVQLSAACEALASWDGTMNQESVGALVLREFAEEFSRNPQWDHEFDRNDPLHTPSGVSATMATTQLLANAVGRIESLGFDVQAPLGDIQFVERSMPDGSPSGERLPWGGANNVEGGFNVFAAQGANDGTLLPRHRYPSVAGSQISEEGYHITSGSSWMFAMEFTDEGPQAEGLLTYSQSSNPMSPWYLDQTELYSQQPQLRPIWFHADDVAANTIEGPMDISLPEDDDES